MHADIKGANQKHRNEQLNRSIQNFLYGLLATDNDVAAKKSLAVLTELWRRHVWRDARTVNVIGEPNQQSCTARCLRPLIYLLQSRHWLGHYSFCVHVRAGWLGEGGWGPGGEGKRKRVAVGGEVLEGEGAVCFRCRSAGSKQSMIWPYAKNMYGAVQSADMHPTGMHGGGNQTPSRNGLLPVLTIAAVSSCVPCICGLPCAGLPSRDTPACTGV